MVELRREGDVTVVEVGAGSIDSLDEERLAALGRVLLDQAAEAQPPRVVLDLSDVDLIGSRFIELVLRMWKRLAERSGTLAVCGLRPFCAEVIGVMRLDALWRIFADRRAAVEALSSEAAGSAEAAGPVA